MVSLLIRPDLGKRPYRLKCRFKIEASPPAERLRRGSITALELFVRDMALQGWEYTPKYKVELAGPFPVTEPMTLRTVRPPSSKEMLAGVRQGERFLAKSESLAQLVVPLSENEHWEYEIRAVFIRNTILTEHPDKHEELEVLRHR